MKRFSVDRELMLLLLLSTFAVAPLFSPGYFFNAHDADHSVFFLVQFDSAIRDGALWPRWGPDHALGYGYPLWLLYAPLAYFAAEGFHLLGLGFTAAVKATWIVGFLFGGWGMFLLLRRWFGPGAAGRGAALVGGLFYVYAPYHLLNVYVRAALAEFWALAWFPWVILAFDALIQRPGRRQVALAALAYAGLLLTHTGTILLFTPLLAAYLVFGLLRRAYRAAVQPLATAIQDAGEAQSTLTALGLSSPWRIAGREFWTATLWALAAGLLAAGLAAIFLLPMLWEQRYIVQSQWVQGSYGYRQHFVFASQLLDPFWGYGFSDDALGTGDGMSFQLGVVAVILGLTTLGVGLRSRARRRDISAFFLLATLATLILMLPMAQPVWDALAPAALLQFPWRLLGLATFCLAILCGSAVANLLPATSDRVSELAGGILSDSDRERIDAEWPAAYAPAAYVLALVVVLASLPFTVPEYTAIEPIDESPQSIIRFETTYPDMIGMTAFSRQAPTDSPLVAQYRSGRPLQKVTLLAGDGIVQTTRVGGASVEAWVNLLSPGSVLFYTYDFPGWRATLDGRRVAHHREPPYGLIAMDVPAGQHTVAIRHGTTPARTIGAVISLISLLVAIWLLWDGGRGMNESANQRISE